MSYVEKLNSVLTRAILTQSRYRENGTHTGKVVIESQTREKLQRRAKEGAVGKKELNDSINLKSYKESWQVGHTSNYCPSNWLSIRPITPSESCLPTSVSKPLSGVTLTAIII